MRARLVLLLPVLFLPYLSHAGELSFLAGATESVDTGQTTHGWQIDFRHDFADSFAMSASWINEGRLDDHHRDGFATQLWGRIPLLERRFSIAFGAGAYRYFDTQARPGGAHANVHGWAPVYGLTATYYTETPWFVRLGVNHVHPPGDIDTSQYLFGAGYRLRKEADGKARVRLTGPDAPPSRTTGTEVMPFLGITVHNSFESRHGIAGGLELRRGISRHLDWTLSWIYEDNREEIRRNGFGSQIWVVDSFLDKRLALGIGAGLYSFLDRFPPPAAGEDEKFDIAGLLSLTASYRLSDRWFARINWNRVETDNQRDSDIFVLGIGRRWED
jgi:hypothetical protein